MKIVQVNIKNFLVIKEASVRLDNRGLILIEGENQDDDSANSNGSGKSSIVDALSWALFGTTARGVSGDAVINRKTKKNCQVTVWLTDGSRHYVVTRSRKVSKRPDLTLQEIVKTAAETKTIEMTKSTVAETQKELEKLLGCSFEIFTSSVYAGQENMPDLPAMTDKQLKLLIEEAAGIDKLQKANESARVLLNEAQKELQTTENEVLSLEKILEEKNADLISLNVKKEEAVKALETKKQDLLTQLSTLCSQPDKPPISVQERQLVDIHKPKLMNVIANYKTLQSQVKAKEDAVTRAHYALESKRAELKKQASENANLKNAIVHIEQKVGTKCSECGKVYTKEDLTGARLALEEKLKALREASQAIVNEMKTLEANQATAQQEAEAARKALPDVAEVMAKINKIDELWQKAVAREEANKEKAERKLNLEAEIKKTEDEMKATPFDQLIEEKTIEIEKKNEEKRKVGEVLSLKRTRCAVLTEVADIFGVKGIRAAILDTITPFLNERTAFYLNHLSDGEITATWQTLTVNAKGDFREKFSIDVQSTKGAASFAGLSGGEKRKVRVATNLALQDLVSSRADKPIDLYIADEVDHALDASGLERLMGLLEMKAKQCGTVLVISHNSLRDWISHVITVTKKDGESSVVDQVS